MSNAINIRKKLTPIQLDKTRHLSYDLNSFVELEILYGSVDKAFEAVQEGSFKAIRSALWAGLIHEDDKLTERQVGSMLTPQDLAEFGKLVGDAMTHGLPDKEEVTNGGDPNALTGAVVSLVE